jgi:hypothetical protein
MANPQMVVPITVPINTTTLLGDGLKLCILRYIPLKILRIGILSPLYQGNESVTINIISLVNAENVKLIC